MIDRNGDIEIDGNRFHISEIKSVYLKTGNLYPNDEQNGNLNKVHLIMRKDMLALTEKYRDASEIVSDYWDSLMQLDKWYADHENYYYSGDYERAFPTNYGQLVCMKDLFQGKMVADFSEKDILIDSGSSFGRPYTWAWLWGKENWYWIGYRLDSDAKGYFLSLRQYRYYKKSKNKEKLVQEKADMFRLLKDELNRLLIKIPLEYVPGGNNAGYNESELGKFYFKDNDIDLLKKHLLPLADEMMQTLLRTGDTSRWDKGTSSLCQGE